MLLNARVTAFTISELLRGKPTGGITKRRRLKSLFNKKGLKKTAFGTLLTC